MASTRVGMLSVGRRVVVELQWVGRGGRFRHVVIAARGWRLLLGTAGIAAVLGLVVAGELALVSQRALTLDRIDTIVRESTTLKERQDALRERAFDLAEQLYWHVGHQRGTARLADSPGHTREDECPRPPARDASNEAILDWLFEHEALLETLASEPVAGRSQTDGRQASDQATATRGTAPAADGARLQVARMGSNE